MKTKTIFLLACAFQFVMSQNGAAQTEFWFEDFGTGCNQGQLANNFVSTNGTWTVTNTGTNTPLANLFFISATEQISGTGCGTGCGGSNSRTLHISNAEISINLWGTIIVIVPADGGAQYSADEATDRRAESPTIDCTDYTDVSISFDYIENGQGTLDNATLWYYDGVTWSELDDMAKTTCCGGPCLGFNQGSFTNYSIALPASADNNPNVRIGFRWVNNNDSNGTDPSFAVDNISISGTESCVPVTGKDVKVFCTSYTWIDGNTYTTNNNTAQYNIVGGAVNGCDSLVTLDLTITGNNLAYTTSHVPATLGFANGAASVSVSGGTPPYTYEWDDAFMQTTPTAVGLFPGTYNCTVTDAALCDVNISVFVDLFTGVPETQVHNNHCNTGGFDLGSIVSANTVQNADAYRWEFTVQGGGVLPEYTRYQANPHIILHWVSGVELNTIYEVRVKARVDGEWGEYGPVCTITTVSDVPLTEVLPLYTPTNAQGISYEMCDLAIAYTINGAQDYQWEFVNGSETVLYTRGSANPSVKLSWVDCLEPNTIYQVRVKANVGGNWGDFGNARPLEFGPTATAQLRPNLCGNTFQLNNWLLPTNVCTSTSFEWELVNTSTSAVHTITTTNAVGAARPAWAVPALVPGAEYSVRVKAFQCGVDSDFGTACNITIAGSTAPGDETPMARELSETTASLFPNPNAGDEVRLELDGLSDGNHEVMIQIYDIYGKLIQTEGFGHAGSALSRLVRFDSELAMGMYMVQIVVDGERFATERLVVN